MRGEPEIARAQQAEATGPSVGASIPAAPTPASSPAAAAATADLARIKILGVLAPILFGIAIEAFRFVAVTETPIARAEHVAIAVITGIGVVAFAFLMFTLIERAQRQVLRQNRELAAMTAVSTAVQGELGVDQLIDAALRTVVDATGAMAASVTVFAREGTKEAGIERSIQPAGAMHAVATGADLPHLIDIPLSAGTAVLGRMRLHLAPEQAEPDLLASATFQNIGHQLACAIQIGQLVADLQRRKSEGHALYDILLRISNQGPLIETLSAVARHARELVAADAAAITVTPAAAVAVGIPAGSDGVVSVRAVEAPDGSTEVSIDGESGGRRPLGLDETIELPLSSPEMPFGELWVGRSGPGFTGREHGFVSTLGELASIAITAARLRESEQQAAVVAERERIAREMHDSLAQVLGVTRLRLLALEPKAARATTPETATAVATEVSELAEIAEEAYRDVREAILGLREASRTDRGFVESLRAYLEKYAHQSGVKASLVTTLEGEPLLTPRAEVQTIRVIQEALTNVRKHARASSAVVRIEADRDWTTVTIEDDGRGFDLGGTLMDRDSGFGLHTMRERMELLGGTLEIDAARGRGTRVIARLPAVPVASVLQNVAV